MRRCCRPSAVALLSLLLLGTADARFRAGAAKVDITPRELPVIQNGGFLSANAKIIADRLHARALVMVGGGDGGPLAICVVDSCMVPTPVCDRAKALASAETGIAPERMLICATHTHSAPSVMDMCLGTDRDPKYTEFLPGKIAGAIIAAHAALSPAQAASVRFDASDYTATRRWVTRPGAIGTDPFGQRTVRATMHPGYQNPDYVGESGPEDPWFSLLSVRDDDGGQLALLGNFSMHYFSGHSGISADYFGRFCKLMETNHGGVALLSQGTSGDLWRADYSKPKADSEISIARYCDELAALATEALAEAKHSREVPLGMAERRVTIDRRTPDSERLRWASGLLETMGERPKNRPEVYARQAVYIRDNPRAEVVLQALRVGELGITAMPNEVYAITGLHLKARSPLPLTMNIELANGAEGYIPPPEQHHLGGYTTWPSVTAGLEVGAEPEIVEHLLQLLEHVCGEGRREYSEPYGAYAHALGRLHPVAHWRFGDLAPNERFEPGVAFFLPGVEAGGFPDQYRSRSALFCGGRFRTEIELGGEYSASFWFWNGLRHNARPVTGYLFSRGDDGDEAAPGDHVGIGGTHLPGANGKLIAFNGNESNQVLAGKTLLENRRWYHCAIVRKGGRITLYLDGREEISGELPATHGGSGQFFLGGRSDNFANFEGRLDEAALFDRALTAAEVAALFETAGLERPQEPEKEAALSPEESLEKAGVPPGFEVELVAAEPLVQDPVAIDWAADGSLWVAEMADYPSGENGESGRIVRLTDEDGDGKPDARRVLVDEVAFPTGVMAWGDGVIATAAGEIFYAEDRDGDGAADLRETWFRGFIEGNQQLRVNGLRWGMDGWIYCASGGHHAGFGVGTVVECVETGERIALGSRDFRFRPDGSFEPLSGPSQFGRACDNDGNWFGVQNAHPLWHYVLDDRYLGRNPHVPAPDPRKQLRGTQPPVFAASKQQKRFHGFDHVGRYTSACGISVYRGSVLFPERAGRTVAFTCEPFSNLVQRHELTDAGPSFTARRADDGDHDFFASADRWCRPVMSRTAPDGSLWVVDMYRYMIEHPQWLPPAGKEELAADYYSGQGMGRIYRVSKKGAGHRWQQPDPAATNGIARDLGLREEYRKRGAPKWDARRIGRSLKDGRAGMRSLGLRMAEGLPDMPAGLAAAAEDPDAKVRLQAAFTLGEFEGTGAGEALVKLATKDGHNPYFAAAILSSAVPHYTALADVADELDNSLVAGLVKMAPVDGAVADSIADRVLERPGGASKWRLLAEAPQAFRTKAREPAREAVSDPARTDAERIAAMALLAPADLAQLEPLLTQRASAELQSAAVRALARLGAHGRVVEAWRSLPPSAREAAQEALLGTGKGAGALLDGLRGGEISVIELSASSRERLLNYGAEAVKRRARSQLGSAAAGDRAEAVETHQPVLSLRGDVAKGRAHFAARCAACHQLGEIGKQVGPDLRGVSNRTPPALLESILDPSRSVEPRYLAYSVNLREGESAYGLIAAETANSVVMLLLDGTERVLARRDIAKVEGTGKSAMPAGLEAGLSHQDLADLLAYLAGELGSG